jgi:hypothetical protein
MTLPDELSGRARLDEALLGVPVPPLALPGHRTVRCITRTSACCCVPTGGPRSLIARCARGLGPGKWEPFRRRLSRWGGARCALLRGDGRTVARLWSVTDRRIARRSRRPLSRGGAQVPYVHVHSGRLGRPATESSLSTGWPLRATWSRYNAIGRSGPSTRLQRCSVSWPRAGPGPLRRVGPGHESGPSPPTGCSGDPGRAPGGTAGACPRPARGRAPPHPANSGRRSRFPRQQSDPVVRAEQATLQHVLEPSVHVGVRKPRSACARLVMSRHLLG